MPVIEIEIRNKIARQSNDVPYVCNNDDYSLAFDFDAEWDAYPLKTARFSYNGKYFEVVFSGNTCQVPVMEDTSSIDVGVYAGDLRATTPVAVLAKKSILCGDDIQHEAPPEDVYNQIMAELNEEGRWIENTKAEAVTAANEANEAKIEANNSAQAAKDAASAAEADKKLALQHASSASDSQKLAADAANAALSHKEEAQTSANLAEQSAQSADSSAADAADSATSAANKASAAASSAANAEASARAAAQRESAAANAAAAAASYANIAAQAATVAESKASEADSSAAKAATSESNAASKAAEAADAANASAQSQSAAGVSAAEAEAFAEAAAQSEAAAAQSAGNAAAAATNAANAVLEEAKESGEFDGPVGKDGTSFFYSTASPGTVIGSLYGFDLSTIETNGRTISAGDFILSAVGYIYRVEANLGTYVNAVCIQRGVGVDGSSLFYSTTDADHYVGGRWAIALDTISTFGRKISEGDLILAANDFLYRVVGVRATEVDGECLQRWSGIDGLCIYQTYSTPTKTSSGSRYYTISGGQIETSGRQFSVGDLILAGDGEMYRIDALLDQPPNHLYLEWLTRWRGRDGGIQTVNGIEPDANGNVEIDVGGGAVGQSDWNQNDETASDYVKNRPFYKYTETTIKESLLADGTYTSESLADYGGAFAAVVPTDSSVVIENPIYTVVFDGVNYPKLKPYESGVGILIGNGALLAALLEGAGLEVPDDTGEPFVVLVSGDATMSSVLLVTDFTQSTTHEFSLTYVNEQSNEMIVKLPEEYYDAGVGQKYGEGNRGEIFNDYESNEALGANSHAEGHKTSANGVNSHAEGYNSHAIGENSHAEGYNSHAIGENSHAEGYNAFARGVNSHTEGSYTDASGENSHAEGVGTYASGANSHAEGSNTKVYRRSQHVQGEYNVLDTFGATSDRGKYAHIVGNGTSEASRSNAHTIDWNGVAWFAGGVQVGGKEQDGEGACNVVAVGSAKVGQTIVVKEVDSTGKPIAWEAVGMSAGGGVGSWDDLPVPMPTKFLPDGVPYVEEGGMVEILPDYTITEDNSEADIAAIPALGLVAGATYTVTLNGTEYTCVATLLEEDGLSVVCLGDAYTLTGGQVGTAPTGEPFVLIEYPPELAVELGMNVAVQPLSENITLPITFSIYGGGVTVHKLDNRCLDLAWLPTSELSTVVEETTVEHNTYMGDFGYGQFPVGTEVVVLVDGTPYKTTVQTAGEGTDQYWFAAIGNVVRVTMLLNNSHWSFVDGASHQVEICVEVYNKMPAEFLPKGTPYVQEDVLLAETNAESSEDPTFGQIWLIQGVALNLTAGETYTILYNGTPYKCVCQTAPDGFTNDPDAVAMGNFASIGGEDTGEPFALLSQPNYKAIAIIDFVGSTAVKVGISGEVAQKMDARCLPDDATVFYLTSPNGTKFAVTVDDDGTLTATAV